MPLNTLPASTTAKQVVQELIDNGAVIVKDVIGTDIVDRLNAEVKPYIDKTPLGHDNFWVKRPNVPVR
jgi:hypothetical protein